MLNTEGIRSNRGAVLNVCFSTPPSLSSVFCPKAVLGGECHLFSKTNLKHSTHHTHMQMALARLSVNVELNIFHCLLCFQNFYRFIETIRPPLFTHKLIQRFTHFCHLFYFFVEREALFVFWIQLQTLSYLTETITNFIKAFYKSSADNCCWWKRYFVPHIFFHALLRQQTVFTPVSESLLRVKKTFWWPGYSDKPIIIVFWISPVFHAILVVNHIIWHNTYLIPKFALTQHQSRSLQNQTITFECNENKTRKKYIWKNITSKIPPHRQRNNKAEIFCGIHPCYPAAALWLTCSQQLPFGYPRVFHGISLVFYIKWRAIGKPVN